MSAVATQVSHQEKNYLNDENTIKSWLLTKDHKRIAVMYLVAISIFFLAGSIAAGMIRLELVSPRGAFLTNDAYNRTFTAHGVIMIFLFLLVGIPAVFGNFLVPLMIGAKDLAFPRLNLVSLYLFFTGAAFALLALIFGGVDTGWTFYTPYSSMYSNSQVALVLVGAFILGFSSIATGVNFIVTIHKMRAPGMTWFRLPLYIWSHYATSIIIILGTPVVAITLLLVVLERVFHLGVFSPELGGDPVLFQHLFWFYSHPAVYIMILPAMGVVSEVIACFSRNSIFGYKFVAMSSMAIALLGFFVWGHHMFISSQSMYQGLVFSLITFLIAVPSAVKVFNWSLTMYKGSVWLASPMIFALGFMGLFVIGGLTGVYLGSIGTDVHLTGTYFIVAHFHYVMVGGTVMGFLAALHFWWPKMFGKMYNESMAKVSAVLVFIGFNVTFFPQFIVGYLGMPRRYHYYYLNPDFQIWNIASSFGSTVLALGFLLPVIYLTKSLKSGAPAGPNPWGATGLEWEVESPPTKHNFHEIPVVTGLVYDYNSEADEAAWEEEEREMEHVTRGGQH
ncbi:MAG: cbb3-type cytochrome c oxidase subunit I [Armatimonadetes bacterium]|nr:cbb3-type cytochrome c oxidase subunit I [Armatimonadota bacterium]